MSLSMCFTTRHGKCLGETLKLPRLERLGSFKVSASIFEAATSRLGLVSVSSRILNVSSRSRLGQNFEHLSLVSKTWVSGSHLGLGSGLVHIPGNHVTKITAHRNGKIKRLLRHCRLFSQSALLSLLLVTEQHITQ